MTANAVFDTAYTLAVPGGAVSICLDPFERQITNLAQLLSLSPVVCGSDSARPAFIQEYSQAARAQSEQGGGNTADAAALDKIDALLKSKTDALTSLPQSTQVEFVNLYLTTLHSVYRSESTANEKLSPLLLTLFNSLSSPVALSSALHFLSPSSPAETRHVLISKLISSPEFAAANLEHLTALPQALTYWQIPTKDIQSYLSTILSTLLENEDSSKAYQVLKSYFDHQQQGDGGEEELEKMYCRLAINQPGVFTFPKFLVKHKEEHDLVLSLFSSSSSSIPTLSDGKVKVKEEVVKSKKTSLAIASLLVEQVGKKVGYAQVGKAAGVSSDKEEEVEAVVIDAIKSKLIQARLHQPTQTISVLSSSYASIEASLPTEVEKAEENKQKKVEQWKLVQAKLLAAKKGLDGVLKGLKGALNGTQDGQKEVEVAA